MSPLAEDIELESFVRLSFIMLLAGSNPTPIGLEAKCGPAMPAAAPRIWYGMPTYAGFALKELTAAVAARIGALVKKAVS